MPDPAQKHLKPHHRLKHPINFKIFLYNWRYNITNQDISPHADAAPEYADSIAKLAGLALHSSGTGARVAGELLLSANNAQECRFNISDLCYLDHNYAVAAFLMLHNRVLMSRGYLSDAIEDGHAVFDQIYDKWGPDDL